MYFQWVHCNVRYALKQGETYRMYGIVYKLQPIDRGDTMIFIHNFTIFYKITIYNFNIGFRQEHPYDRPWDISCI